MKSKKILIITSQFPPFSNSLGGVIRNLSYTKKLKKNLFDVSILTKKNNFHNYFGYKDYLEDLNIIYINKSFKKQSEKKIKGFLKNKTNIYKIKNILSRFGIDYDFKNLVSYFKEVYKLNSKEKIDFILISAPPFSLFLLVPFIRLFFKKKIIIDYRDGWNTRFEKNYFLYFLANYIEKLIIHICDDILVSTKVIKEKLINQFNINENKIECITNGFEHNQSINQNCKIKNKKNTIINVGYFGMINDNKNSYRDINIVFKLFENELIKNKFRFHFYGESIINNEEINKSNYFNFYGNLKHKDAIDEMYNMDYLLILHTEEETSAEVMTGKFYDYLSTLNKIIVISKGETLVGKIIQNNSFGFNFNILKCNITDELNKLATNKIEKNNVKDIKYYSRDYQNDKLIRLLNFE